MAVALGLDENETQDYIMLPLTPERTTQARLADPRVHSARVDQSFLPAE